MLNHGDRDSPVTGLHALPTERMILRELRADALQHGGTVVPFAIAVVSGAYFIVLSPLLGGAAFAISVAAISGLAGIGNFMFRFLRVNDKAGERIGKVLEERAAILLEAEEAELEQTREQLREGFASIRHKEGKKALEELVQQFRGTWEVLETYQGPDVLSIARLKITVKETYKQGLAVLSHALSLLRADSTYTVRDLETEMETLTQEAEGAENKEISAIKRGALARTQERLVRLKEYEEQIAKLLDQSDQLEAALEQSRLDFARATAENFEGGAEEIIQKLSGIIGTALEVQRMMRRMSGVDASHK